MGTSRPSEVAVGGDSGLRRSGPASDISMVGMAVSKSGRRGASSSGTAGARRLFNLNVCCRGGGGGSIADCGCSCCSGVFGISAFCS